MSFLCAHPLARGDGLYIEVFARDAAAESYAVRGVVRHVRQEGPRWRVGDDLARGFLTATRSR